MPYTCMGVSGGSFIPFVSKIYFKSSKERTHKLKFVEPVRVGVLAGYEATFGHGWPGIFIAWKLEDFWGMGPSQITGNSSREHSFPIKDRFGERQRDSAMFEF